MRYLAVAAPVSEPRSPWFRSEGRPDLSAHIAADVAFAAGIHPTDDPGHAEPAEAPAADPSRGQLLWADPCLVLRLAGRLSNFTSWPVADHAP